MRLDLTPPRLTPSCFQVWRRNLLVWRKLMVPSLLGNLADPTFYMLGLGFGIGALMPAIDGVPYITFLAAGTICYATMNSATFEALYSAFSRMHVQRTWDSIMNAPVGLDDIVFAETMWAASKSVLSGIAILLLIWLLGLSHSPLTLWLIPLMLLMGVAFASMAMVMTALAGSYDFFMYYFSLLVTPMVLLSGVFYPISALPPLLQQVGAALPLSHAIDLARPLVYGRVPEDALLHLGVLALYAIVGFMLALILVRRRLLE
ncbi:MAG: ABC transporter permease [Burkholderiales bacterium]|nr:ABC transporter permease [Burkholderiales bacterium]